LRRGAGGFSLLECLAAIAIVGLLLSASFVLLERKRLFLRTVAERLHAEHAIEKEMETVRALPFAELTLREDAPFVSDPVEVAGLPLVRTLLTVEKTEVDGLRRLRARVVWGKRGEKQHAGEALVAAWGPR
jgi:prepilin-type N-terminal cleavage/methylation domain-containing protein